MPANWRLLEAEIIRIVRKQGFEISEAEDGNKIVGFEWEDGLKQTLDLTELAQTLAEYK